MNSSTSKNIDNRLPEVQAYMENVMLNGEIAKISETKGFLHRIKMLKELRASYFSPLSLSHIDYYTKKYINSLMNRFVFCIVVFLIIIYFAFTQIRILTYYERFNNFDISEKTFQKAISYYDAGDYDAALVRLEKLYANGWHDYATVHYLSQTYQAQNKYNTSAKLLLNILTDEYGTANVTTNNKFFTELTDIWSNQLLSTEIFNNVTKVLNQINSFSSLYLQLYTAICEQNYDDAEYYCQTLKNAGAYGFSFTAYYITVLINTGRINEAYELVMGSVKNDNSWYWKKITSSQRVALMNYIMPHLNNSQIDECNQFLYDDSNSLDIIKASDSAEPFIEYNDVELLFTTNISISALNYLAPFDTITIAKETTLVNGRECYYIKVNHFDGAYINSEYFFMDMEQNIYIFMDEKYHLLPTDKRSYSIDIDNMIKQNYYHYDNPNILLSFQYDESNANIYSLKNNTTGEIIFNSEPTNTSLYGAYAYLVKDNSSFTVFFTIDDAILLVTKDSEQKYRYLEGRYLLSE